MLLDELRVPPRDALVAEAIRQMARDLREYEASRVADMSEVLDRTTEYLANHLGRCPTAAEVAEAGGVSVEEVLDDLEAIAAQPDPRRRTALALRCEGYDRDEIAERLGVGRCAVSRLLRGAMRTP